MKHISDILKKSSLTKQQVISLQITAAWPKIIAEIYPSYTTETKAAKYVGHTLTIITITSQHLMNLQMKETELLVAYSHHFGAGVVNSVKFKIGRL